MRKKLSMILCSSQTHFPKRIHSSKFFEKVHHKTQFTNAHTVHTTYPDTIGQYECFKKPQSSKHLNIDKIRGQLLVKFGVHNII